MFPKIEDSTDARQDRDALADAAVDGEEWPELSRASAKIDELAALALKALDEGRTTEFPR